MVESAVKETLVVAIAGVLIFNGTMNIPKVGNLMSTYPYYTILAGVLLIFLSRKIAGK